MRYESDAVATPLWSVPHPEEGHGEKEYLCSDNKRRDSTGAWIKPDNCDIRRNKEKAAKFQIVRRKDGWLAADDDAYIRFYVCNQYNDHIKQRSRLLTTAKSPQTRRRTRGLS